MRYGSQITIMRLKEIFTMKKTNDPKRIAREGMIASIAIEKGKKAGLTPFQTGMIRGIQRIHEDKKKSK